MKYNLFLDDIRVPIDAFKYTHNTVYRDLVWIVVRSYQEFVDYITDNGMPDVISFDHDLANVHYALMNDGPTIDYDLVCEKTGYHCAKWLVEYCSEHDCDVPEYHVHSMNPVGGENIRSYLMSYIKFKRDN